MTTMPDAKNMLEASKTLIHDGCPDDARKLLLELIDHDPGNGRAWYTYSFVVEGLEKQIDAVEKTLILRPDSRRAAYRLQHLMQQLDPPDRNTDLALMPDSPTKPLRANPLAPKHKRKLPPSLWVTGVIVAGTFIVLMVLSINTLLEASQPRTLPTLLPLGSVGETSVVLPENP